MANIISVHDDNIIQLDEIKNFGKYFRRRDIRNVEAVVSELRDAGVVPYLGGSVLDRHLSHGDKKYGDIDLLGVVMNTMSEPFMGLSRKLWGFSGEGAFLRQSPSLTGGRLFILSLGGVFLK